ncbi:hypothetical protein [Coleofasciculus sp. FACHB-1120]|nr:hypothetical protein [Coleofasciculus sp. FACHB-1120]
MNPLKSLVRDRFRVEFRTLGTENQANSGTAVSVSKGNPWLDRVV